MKKETRTCKGCNISMPLDYFANTGMFDKNGKPYKRYYCTKNVCYWAHKKKTPSGRIAKAKAIRDYKRNLKCCDCGYSKETRKRFSTWGLQFHHHDADKEANVGDMLSQGFSLKKIFAEIKKCIVLCALCHIELHAHQNH